MDKLWLKQNDIAELTSLNGNIDADKLKQFIFLVQTTEIKRVLGVDLYAKINTDIQNNTALVDDYKFIFDSFVTQMLVYWSCSKYILMGGFQIANAGIFRTVVDNAQMADIKDVKILSQEYWNLGASLELSFYDYIKTKNLPEYTVSTDDGSTGMYGWF